MYSLPAGKGLQDSDIISVKNTVGFFTSAVRMSVPESNETFNKKYDEFAKDLLSTYPELDEPIQAALALSVEERQSRYKAEVFSMHQTLNTNVKVCPGTILPGITLTEEMWSTTGDKSRKIIYEYISILNLTTAFQAGGDSKFTKEWAEKMMKDARASMDSIDFDKISKSFFEAFGTKGSALPPFPEKFLKGKLAKLAEEMVREFKPEEFGFTKEELEACERDPARAFEILMKGSMGNPKLIQSAMGRIAKKLQDKVSRGELKPQELVDEADSLMKEFQSHPAFVELMQSFRTMFGGDDVEEMQKAAGRDNDNRLSIARARLRKKLEERRGKK